MFVFRVCFDGDGFMMDVGNLEFFINKKLLSVIANPLNFRYICKMCILKT